MVLASEAARPENSGVYEGLLIHMVRPTIPSTSTATPMRAMVRWAIVNSRIAVNRRRNAEVTWAGIRLASS
jgi:hypothetical protein